MLGLCNMKYIHGFILTRALQAMYRFGMATSGAHRVEKRNKEVMQESGKYVIVPMSDDEKAAYHMQIMNNHISLLSDACYKLEV
jgi:hypothetical protein